MSKGAIVRLIPYTHCLEVHAYFTVISCSLQCGINVQCVTIRTFTTKLFVVIFVMKNGLIGNEVQNFGVMPVIIG